MGSNRITVVDAGPIIHLDQIDSLQLLSVFDSVVVPETVYKELSAGEIPENLGNLEYEIRTAEGDTVYEGLDKGETAALQLAEISEADPVFLTDDLDAREQSNQLDIEVHGSIGIIVLNFSQGDLKFDEAVSLMRRLQEETQLFVTETVVERGIDRLRELQQR
jgi:predicted nucleic acid-binding protein